MPDKKILQGRYFRLKQFYDIVKDNSWLVLGKTSAWNRTFPVAPATNLYRVPEALVLVYFHKVKMVYQSDKGELTYEGFNYREHTDNNLGIPTYLYLEARIPSGLLSQFGYSSYRMYGYYHSVTFYDYTPKKLEKEVVDPSLVKDYIFDWASSFKPINITDNYEQTIKILREF